VKNREHITFSWDAKGIRDIHHARLVLVFRQEGDASLRSIRVRHGGKVAGILVFHQAVPF
jgi:hypothetical protein